MEIRTLHHFMCKSLSWNLSKNLNIPLNAGLQQNRFCADTEVSRPIRSPTRGDRQGLGRQLPKSTADIARSSKNCLEQQLAPPATDESCRGALRTLVLGYHLHQLRLPWDTFPSPLLFNVFLKIIDSCTSFLSVSNSVDLK